MIKAIMAVDQSWGAGKNGTLPWPANKEDLKQFKDKTTGHIVIMGSNTWFDPCFPAPLKNRINIVVTTNPDKFDDREVIITSTPIATIEELSKIHQNKDVWIIGGINLIDQCWNIIEEFHLTIINGHYDCDKFLDFQQLEDNFTLIQGDILDNAYYIYRRAI